MKHLIITGATGLIGRNFVEFLKDKDIEVHAVGHGDYIHNLPQADYKIHAAGYGQPK